MGKTMGKLMAEENSRPPVAIESIGPGTAAGRNTRVLNTSRSDVLRLDGEQQRRHGHLGSTLDWTRAAQRRPKLRPKKLIAGDIKTEFFPIQIQHGVATCGRKTLNLGLIPC
jgi:phosphoribosylanthranilate isomerase